MTDTLIPESELHPQPHFLGLDASTQALKASLLSANLDVLAEAAVNFDADLPQLGTKGGVLKGPEGSGEVYAPVEVLGLAIDLLMQRIKGLGWDLSAVRGVAAAGQVRPFYNDQLIQAGRTGSFMWLREGLAS